MDELKSLGALAKAMGVHTEYTDGLNRHVTVGPDTLVRVCAALGAPIARPAHAAEALRALEATRKAELLPPVLVAWQGDLTLPASYGDGSIQARLRLAGGEEVGLERQGETLRPGAALPYGYHRLTIEAGEGSRPAP